MLTKLLIFIIFATCVKSWHPTGHFLTALIAENELKRMGKTSMIQKMNMLLNVLKPMTKERNHAFVECACFPDDIKYLSWTSFNKWHFYDDYIVEKGYSRELAAKLHRSKHNILTAINEAKEALRNTRKSLVDDHLPKSFELRYLIHLIGDLHQPLHSTSYVGKDFSKGDVGGNAFLIDHPAKNLHTLWDKCLTTKEFKDVRAPINEKDWDYLQNKAEYLVKKYPRSALQARLDIKGAKEWIKESRKIAIEHVYKGLTKGIKITDDYITKNIPIVEAQVTIGGYRLANILVDLFNDETVFEKHLKNGDEGSEDEDVPDAAVPMDDKEDSSNESDSENPASPAFGKPIAKAEPVTDDTSSDEKSIPKNKKTAAKTPAKKADIKPAAAKTADTKPTPPAVIKVDTEKPKQKKAAVPEKKFIDSSPKPAKKLDAGKKPAPGKRRRRMLDDYEPESELDDSDFYSQLDVTEERNRKGPNEVNQGNVITRFFKGAYALIFGE